MNRQKALESLIRQGIPTITALEYLDMARRDGSYTIGIAGEGEGDTDHEVVVYCNRGGMENAYSISIS